MLVVYCFRVVHAGVVRLLFLCFSLTFRYGVVSIRFYVLSFIVDDAVVCMQFFGFRLFGNCLLWLFEDWSWYVVVK